MKIIRNLYFNPLVNRLNKNLKITQKSYLAFLLVSIMLVIFSAYVLYSYAEIKQRELKYQNLHALYSSNSSLNLLLEKASKQNVEKDKVFNNINTLDKTLENLKNQAYVLNFNFLAIENTIAEIRDLSILSTRSGVQKQLDIAQIDEIRKDLTSYNNKIEKSLTLISRDTDSLFRTKNMLIYLFLVSGLLGSVIIANFISYRITDPIGKLNDNIKILEEGNYDLDSNFEVLDNDEIGDIVRGIESIGSTIKETVNFTEKIGRNEFHSELDLNKEGKLGKALLSMRDNLNEVTRQNEIQKKQEEKRNWVIKGLAELGNVLRSNFDDEKEFYFQILRTIINYINANQGGFFIIKEGDHGKLLELSSSYAFDRRKYLTKQIEIGEGLIGQCAYEKQLTNITDIPDNYINITSGLGGSNPRNLILIPLVLNEEIYGVIELASFEKFDEYQIDYLKQSSESIASALSSIQINSQTKLLLEKTKIQAEEIASREEEMRQNMEELEATQEESQRKVEHLERIIEDLKKEKQTVD